MLNVMNAETFGQRLRRLRGAAGKSQRRLAIEVGLSNGSISQAENDKLWVDQLPSLDILRRLARALGVTVDMLAGEENTIPAPIVLRPRQLTEDELFARFGIRRYEEPQSGDGLRYSAGGGGGVVQGIDDTLPRRIRGSKYLWEAPVVGDCMESEIHSGEIVIYSTRVPIEIGRIVVALRDEDELLIKRLRLAGDHQVLRPNRGEDVPVDERIRFLGRGMAVQRPLE